MPPWLHRVLQTLVGGSEAGPSARAALDLARRTQAKLTVEVQVARRSVVLSSVVEQVRRDDFIIAQPTLGEAEAGGVIHPLAFGEQLVIGFMHGNSHYSARTKCLGRIKMEAPGASEEQGLTASPNQPIPSAALLANRPIPSAALLSVPSYGYRLALPSAFRQEQRRASPRTAIEFNPPIKALLYAPGGRMESLEASITQVSMSGAHLSIAGTSGVRVVPHQTFFLKARLPEPAGLMDELVTVAKVDGDGQAAGCVLDARFEKRVDAVVALLRQSN